MSMLHSWRKIRKQEIMSASLGPSPAPPPPLLLSAHQVLSGVKQLYLMRQPRCHRSRKASCVFEVSEEFTS